MTEVHKLAGLPDVMLIDKIEEPVYCSTVITSTLIGGIMTLWGKRGELIKQGYIW